jgi:hypothetical protein
MSDEILLRQLTSFLASPIATVICRSYRADPHGALGELFLRLAPRAQQPVRNPTAWVRANAIGLLRNYLRAECRPLAQHLET